MRQVWEYEIAGGVKARGIFVKYFDRGGTDVTYWFHRLNTDGVTLAVNGNGGLTLDSVSGARLKEAKRVGAIPTTQQNP